MQRLSAPEISFFLLAIAVLLGSARIMGGLAVRLRQPPILGEILAGVLLGPTVLGHLWPAFGESLFPAVGSQARALEGLLLLAITLFLLVAGMEVNLSAVWRQGRAAICVGVTGILIPFAVGFASASLVPELLGSEGEVHDRVFALFFATALSISALPVIARTLMDLGLYRTDFGMLVVASAVFDDLTGWIVFAVVLGMMGKGSHGLPIGHTIWLTLGFAASMLTIGRWAIDRILPWIQSGSRRPGAVMSFALTSALVCAALAEWIGVHAIFGAFLLGVALGESSHLREQTRVTMERFISFFFAPVFFASIGLRVDFAAHFDPVLVLIVVAIASVGKLLGCGLGARLGGLSKREAWAVGFGMNSRGAMEIIVGMLALDAGLIGERLFVALVVMALVTSMVSGPAIQALLGSKRVTRFTDHLTSAAFVNPVAAADRQEAIRELVAVAARAYHLDAASATEAVLAREKVMGTGLPNGVAIPHARLPGLDRAVLAVGASAQGIDFDSPDGAPAHMVVVILTPERDGRIQLEILADLARTFRSLEVTKSFLAASDYGEFLDLARSHRRDDADVGGLAPARSVTG